MFLFELDIFIFLSLISYNDDEMFSGRVIIVTGSLEKGIEDANLKG